jgi:hypothetical protein
VVNIPALFNFFYKGIAPFLDPVTRDKMRFNPELLEFIPRQQLDVDFGGDYEFVFDKDAYWNQIIRCVGLSKWNQIFIYTAIDMLQFRVCGIAKDGTRARK